MSSRPPTAANSAQVQEGDEAKAPHPLSPVAEAPLTPLSTTPRNAGLDCLKCLAAFLVVCIHAPFSGTFGIYFSTITRCAVPIFFMISGYYFSFGDHARTRRQIIKLLALIFEANLIYFPWMLLFSGIKGDGISAYLERIFSSTSILKFLFLNESPFGFHLWYLSAILYVLLLMKLLERLHIEKILSFLVPALLIGNLVLGTYAPLLFGREFSTLLTRNFLFFGLPHFYLGHLCQLKKEKFSEFGNHVYLLLIIFFIFTGIMERYLLASLDQLNPFREAYLSSTLLAGALLLFFAKNTELGKETIFQKTGQKFSMHIYILHPMIKSVIKYALIFAGAGYFYELLAPVIVFVVTALFFICKEKMAIKVDFGFSTKIFDRLLKKIESRRLVARGE